MEPTATQNIDWDRIDALKFEDEARTLTGLLASHALSLSERERIGAQAVELVEGARREARNKGVVESFLQEFSLGTQEGLALMCLAEALLRTPDRETRDKLIAEKIAMADWAAHQGKSDNLFVNASTWGLMLTGKLVTLDEEIRRDASGYFKRLLARLGEPVIRQAVASAVSIMGEQFVLGRRIESALERARREDMVCSFDMLGEGARTRGDAQRYERLYAEAIEKVGAAASGAGPELGHGVSVKLSALCERYDAVQEERVFAELYPRLRRLALAAARYDLNFTIDAEEADRLVISLKLFDRLAREAELGDWQGLGFVVQAYQKRARAVIASLGELARQTGRRIMVRLVKGAYWDSEIKRAQVAGLEGFAVFTTKSATDLSYLVCARDLIALHPHLYPQFASHNAHTLAAVRHMAETAGVTVEHQRLHGMGEALYRAAQKRYGALRLRAYAPVGGHEDLLPYLVRRLLENGANSSFVHALLDEDIPAQEVVRDPIAKVETHPNRHPAIALPADLYGAKRRNSPGRDSTQASVRRTHRRTVEALRTETLESGPIVGGEMRADNAESRREIVSPANRAHRVGRAFDARARDIEEAVALARAAQPGWDRAGGEERARVLRAMGDALEEQFDRLVALLAFEAGKTYADGVAEVREAIDFCRYYALLAEREFAGARRLMGPVGETNEWELCGRGIFVCISPWNFPLAIFTGQIAAALAAGNTVLAKPAEQTPLIAAQAVRLFHQAGLDPALLALLPGDGPGVGARLVAHPAIDGVAFTGGTDTAFAINRQLAAKDGPIVPFIAETGGLNAMFVDTTALREQVIDDVLLSAFGSAGQRCSALRVLFAPEDSADVLIEGLVGALASLNLGDPALPHTDIGPVIDAEAKVQLERHLERLEAEARILARHAGTEEDGHFFAPTIAEIDAPDFLEREVFGPILHICRYRAGQLDEYAQRLAARGYGLTLGVHSRLESFARRIERLVPAGNFYVNRSMIGAVVGVQPFGGVGLSGTGPKAGGPHALTRYASERARSINIMAMGGDPELLQLGEAG